MASKSYKTLRLILGDQLNAQHSWFKKKNPEVIYVIAELKQEAEYTRHHIQKLCAFFAAMDAFAKALVKAGHAVEYLTLEETKGTNLTQLMQQLSKRFKVQKFEYQRPDEYRLLKQLQDIRFGGDLSVCAYDTEHFLLPFDDIDQYFKRDTHTRMENFYRKMRKRFHILMDGDKPEGEKWNYDQENRSALKKEDLDKIPKPLVFSTDVSNILARIKKFDIPHFGKAERHLIWPTTRQQAKDLLEYFIRHCLPHFGRFQDAMTANHPDRWSLFHSRLSFAINSKILHPHTVIDAAVDAYNDGRRKIDIAQVEGFVRQILGWREYIRGVYWVNMPAYAKKNHLDAKRDLPKFFWDGKTSMRCLSEAIGQSLDYAYAHHIQRLMITGNFCLLAGIDPDQVDEWYLGIYIDAIEWVEMPNTRGMSQFADGGIVGTKPYAAGGNYVSKMSDYCKSCKYDVKKKTEEDACPLNSMYWQFLDRHRDKFGKNQRMSMVYRNWDKQEQSKRKKILKRAQWCIDNRDSL